MLAALCSAAPGARHLVDRLHLVVWVEHVLGLRQLLLAVLGLARDPCLDLLLRHQFLYFGSHVVLGHTLGARDDLLLDGQVVVLRATAGEPLLTGFGVAADFGGGRLLHALAVNQVDLVVVHRESLPSLAVTQLLLPGVPCILTESRERFFRLGGPVVGVARLIFLVAAAGGGF